MSAIKERPILFSAPMVRAILDGRKTQTRRAVTHKWPYLWEEPWYTTGKTIVDLPTQPGAFMEFRHRQQDAPCFEGSLASILVPCRYGKPGERLWVRETWAHDAASVEQCRAKYEDAMGGPCYGPYYRATECAPDTLRWIPSIHMPRWASRINLGITSVRVERLQDISRGDCMAEGCPFPNMAESDQKQWYADSWNSTHKADTWDKNPWVWVVEFKRAA